MQRMMLLIPIV